MATSDHVRREWKRIVWKTVSAFLEALEHQPDLSAAVAKMGFGFGREPAQRWRALALITAGSDSLDVTDATIRSRQLLRGDMDRRFDATVGTVRDSSACGLALEEPAQTPTGKWELKWTCKRREGICDHEQRLHRQLADWTAGASALRASGNTALKQMGDRAVMMAREADKRTGVNCYGKTGDLAIALDCQAGEELVTTDASFAVMASAMGFTVRRIPT